MGFCFVSLFPPFFLLFFSFLFFFFFFLGGGGRTASVFLGGGGGHGPRWPPPPGSAVGHMCHYAMRIITFFSAKRYLRIGQNMATLKLTHVGALFVDHGSFGENILCTVYPHLTKIVHIFIKPFVYL